MIFNSVIMAAGGPTTYSITNDVTSYVSLNKNSAEEGETITATLTAIASGATGYYASSTRSSYDIQLFRVNSGKGSNEVGDTATFAMPSHDMYIISA